MVSKGFFIVADISGYTEFLTKSELEHAEFVLDNLFKAQIEQLDEPFVISSFRGDGILAYALDDRISSGKELIQRLNRVYYSFSHARETMYHNITCPCNACMNIPQLDLKLFVHHGSFMLQKIGDREEMLGPDVIVVHRMMKNQVREKTGIGAYSLFTNAAVEALGISELDSKLVPYQDEYEHIGKINMYVYDLSEEYHHQRERKRIEVTPETAHIVFELSVPVSSSKAWEFLSTAQNRRGFLKITSRFPPEEFLKSVYDHGAGYTNLHELESVIDVIVDWQAGHFFTTESVGYDDSRYRSTYLIKSTEHGSDLQLMLEILTGDVDSVKVKYEAGMASTISEINRELELLIARVN